MPVSAILQFPQGFLWGTATAAHQNEGETLNDWSRWEQTPGHVYQDRPSGRATEWWAGRYLEDFDRAVAMHNNALRLSVEWSRIEPRPGNFDEDAIARYRAMLMALRERQMAPMVTLHHFTNPLWVTDQGGWQNPSIVDRFARFARYVVEKLGDLCSLWCTINEPMVYATQGYTFGIWPPGQRDRAALVAVVTNLVSAHAAAYHAIKAEQPAARVGIAMHHLGLEPSAPKWLNRPAQALVDRYFNRAFAFAIRDGALRLPGGRPVPIPGAKGTMDWIGLQYYQVFKVAFDLGKPSAFFLRQSIPTDRRVGPPPWGGIDPDSLFDHLRWYDKAFHHLPIYITECGVPDTDDSIRPEYLIRTVRAAWKAVNFNFPIRGLFFWTLVDNYEWDKGYNPAFNFGLYRTDFDTQERTARPSAALFGAICGQNGLSADVVGQYAPDLLPTFFPASEGAQVVSLNPPVSTTLGEKRATKS